MGPRLPGSAAFAVPVAHADPPPLTHPLAAKRQTLLFSATQTRNVEDLARVSLKKEPMYIGVDDNKVCIPA